VHSAQCRNENESKPQRLRVHGERWFFFKTLSVVSVPLWLIVYPAVPGRSRRVTVRGDRATRPLFASRDETSIVPFSATRIRSEP